MLEKLITQTEVTKLLDLDVATVRRYCKQGRLPFYELPGGRRRFRQFEVLAACAPTRERVAR